MRNVRDRLIWYRTHRPSAAGMCAQHVMLALAVRPQGFPDATAVCRAVKAGGHMRQGPAPRGAIVYWSGGARGHGHVCFALGDQTELSVDVNGPRTVGIKPFPWFRTHWPALKYEGWSWYFGRINTRPL